MFIRQSHTLKASSNTMTEVQEKFLAYLMGIFLTCNDKKNPKNLQCENRAELKRCALYMLKRNMTALKKLTF